MNADHRGQRGGLKSLKACDVVMYERLQQTHLSNTETTALFATERRVVEKTRE